VAGSKEVTTHARRQTEQLTQPFARARTHARTPTDAPHISLAGKWQTSVELCTTFFSIWHADELICFLQLTTMNFCPLTRGAALSNVVSGYMLGRHKHATGQLGHGCNGMPVAVCRSSWVYGGKVLGVTAAGRWCVHVCLWGGLAALVAGALLPFASMLLCGFLGYLAEELQGPWVREGSVVELFLHLASSTYDQTALVYILCALCLVLVLVVPLLQMIVLAVLWSVRTLPRTQQRCVRRRLFLRPILSSSDFARLRWCLP